jgi:hypothetical protein
MNTSDSRKAVTKFRRAVELARPAGKHAARHCRWCSAC